MATDQLHRAEADPKQWDGDEIDTLSEHPLLVAIALASGAVLIGTPDSIVYIGVDHVGVEDHIDRTGVTTEIGEVK